MTYIIDRVRTTGKYIEFWFEDYHTQIFYEFHRSDKLSYFNIAIAVADLEDYVLNNGVKGLCVEFDDKENIKSVCVKVTRCRKPPIGWICSKDRGHDGPCSATKI